MGSTQICVCVHKYIGIIYLLALFASTSIFTLQGLMAEGRAISMISGQRQSGKEEKGLGMMEKGEIGSRPPKCEGRCRSCGHCEAVQVPVVPQVQIHSNTDTNANSRTRTTYSGTMATPHSRGDDLSNYKPMSWKCKCGNYFFNP
ncbi:EPIDERMAL PATTERNING FACTOR-like protein 2 [Senna tora]|uniref:Epidermal patterning factor-like protein n=1 Tax=Senna tora TaxID=362788 RepID=A0A834T870_9FABA|nr:EPIDERMAL PATTERNING FACTOR-like protein 2 [Senna tora]